MGHPSFHRVGEAFTALVVGGPIAGLGGLLGFVESHLLWMKGFVVLKKEVFYMLYHFHQSH